MPETRSARTPRWVIVTTVVYGLVVLVVVTLPIGFGNVVVAIGELVRAMLGTESFGFGWIEAVANVVMIVPLAFLAGWWLRRFLLVAVLGCAASAAIEIIQLVVPDRVASVRDIVANTTGAAIGAGLAWLASRRRTIGRASELAAPESRSLRASSDGGDSQ